MNLNYLRRKTNVAIIITAIYWIATIVGVFIFCIKISTFLPFELGYWVALSPLYIFVLFYIGKFFVFYAKSCNNDVSAANKQENDEKILNSIPYKWEKVELKNNVNKIDSFLRRQLKQVYIRRLYGNTLEIKIVYNHKLSGVKIKKKWSLSFEEAKEIVKLK